MRLTVFLLAVMGLSSGRLCAQSGWLNEVAHRPQFTFAKKPPTKPDTYSGLVTDALDHAFDSIAQLTDVKGFNAAVLLPDGTYWKRAKGLFAEYPTAVSLQTEHLMGMGSISKSFMSTTLLRLQEEGVLDLDDSIGQYLPAYPNISGAATIRQLLSHRTGFNDYLNENPAMLQEILTHLDSIWAMDTILSHYVLAPNFPLGASWSYSNTNYLLAGRIIEAVSGRPWYEVVREKVIDPIGLLHTFAYPWESQAPQQFAHVFADLDGVGDLDDFQGYGLPDEGLFSAAASAGSLISNPEDLTKFCNAVYGGHFLQPESLIQMETDFVQDGSGVLYGLGALSIPNPYQLENWGHNGDLIYKSVALSFPEAQIAIAVQQNDDRYTDPSDPNTPDYDLYGMFETLLYTWVTSNGATAVVEPGDEAQAFEFANPVNDELRVRVAGNGGGMLELSDVLGRIVASARVENGQSEMELDLSAVRPGAYYLRYGTLAAKPCIKTR